MKTKLLIILGAVAVFVVVSFAETKTNRNEITTWMIMATNRISYREGITSQEIVSAIREYGQLTNVVNLMVTSGVVCEVRGHDWQIGCGMVGCLVIHAGNMRHCSICKASQTQSISEWK